MQRELPPFRADHVGSLLRPASLKDARGKHAAVQITAAELKAIKLRLVSELADEVWSR